MSEDFGTINVRRGERARELEVLRQHYRQHREALQRMNADAPTEYLATEYQRLLGEIDRALAKLQELEAGATAPTPAPRDPLARAAAPAAAPPAPPPPPHPARRGQNSQDDIGTQPLIVPPAATTVHDIPIEEGSAESSSRLPLIVAAAIFALALIGWLIWRASSDRPADATVVSAPGTETAGTLPAETAASSTTATATAAGLAAVPTSHDYGTIGKGTRATRQFEIENQTDEPVTIVVARSTCRCLYYEHAPVIPPRAKENLTVTIDGARAKVGELRESVKITAKSDPGLATTVDVIATIR